MNYQHPQLRHTLAAHYVLGSLSPRARRRVQQLLTRDTGLRQTVSLWEARFAQLGLRLPPVAPREMVWLELARRLQSGVTPLRPAPVAANRLLLWKTWAGLATAAALLLGVRLTQLANQPPPAAQIVRVEVPVVQPAAKTYVAMLQPQKSAATWLVSVSPEKGRMSVKVMAGSPANQQQDCQLWVIANGKPVSVGVLPRSGAGSMAWPGSVPFAEGLTVAVSLEPAGGSPTGAPTGPVIAAAPITEAG